MIQEDWDIQARAHDCQACSTEFPDKATYHTILSFTPGGYQRMDVCQTCWDSQYSHGSMDRKGAFSHWRGKYKAPPPPQPEPIQKETAETLLRKLIESKDPAHAHARYILGVMLERKRILKHRDTTEHDGQKILVYEHAKTAETLLIPDPGLNLDQIELVQKQVFELLNPPKPAEPSPAPAPATTESAPVESAT
jgi:hypothetical protein